MDLKFDIDKYLAKVRELKKLKEKDD